MLKEKSLHLLQTFTPQETQRFMQFIQSPYYNKRDEIIQFYDALRPSINKSQLQEHLPETIWKNVFGKKKFDKNKYNRMLSDLNALANKFVMVNYFNQYPHLQAGLLLNNLNNRELDKHYNYLFTQAKKDLEETPFKEGDFFYQQFLVEQAQNKFLERKQNRSEGRNLDHVMNALDHFYLVNKLQTTCAVLHYKQVNSIEVPIRFFDELMNHFHNNDYSHVPVIKLYYYILLTLLHPAERENFDVLKKILIEEEQKLSMSALNEGYEYAINFCIRRINAAQPKYFQEIFELYKLCLRPGILIKKNKLSPGNYKNIITTSLRVKAYDFAEDFIKKYSQYLPIEEQKNAFAYNLANLDFEKKKYDQCLKRLQEVTYEDVFYLLGTKLMQIKALYETEEHDALDSLLHSFRLLLKRKKIISDLHRIRHNNFIRYVSAFVRTVDKEKIKRLQSDLNAERQIADLAWLKEKAAELV